MQVQLPNERDFTELDIDENQFTEQSRVSGTRFGWYKGLFIGIKLMLVVIVGQAQIVVVNTVDDLRQLGADYVGCTPGEITMPVYYHVTDTPHYWNYYNANGTILWRDVKNYDVSLIPVGGYAGPGPLIKQPYIIKGFSTFYITPNCRMDSVIKRVDLQNKDIAIKGRIIHPAILPR